MAVSRRHLSSGLETQHKARVLSAFVRVFDVIKKPFDRLSINPSKHQVKEEAINTHATNNDTIEIYPDDFNSKQTRNTDIDVDSLNSLDLDYSVLRKRVKNNRKMFKSLSLQASVYPNNRESRMNSLFSYLLIVGLERTGTQYKTKVMWQFPENAEVDPNIRDFCFPDAKLKKRKFKRTDNQIFQFALTDFNGSRSYGFCLKMISKSFLPIIICIISPVHAIEIYNSILDEIQKLYVTDNIEMDMCKDFLTKLYSTSFPRRGETLAVWFGTENLKCIELKRNHDRRLERDYLHKILKLNAKLIIKIFASILTERKIIFLSNKLRLSNIIQTFEMLLYPFSWPHTFVPVLPSFLIDMCEAPTPYMIGVMRHQKNEVMSKDISDVLVVDLDNQKCIQEDGNELKILPHQIVNWIKADIENILLIPKDQKRKRNELLCEIFLNVFVKTVGHYKEHLVYDENDERWKVNYETFVNASQNTETRQFLKWFTKTQIFETFILNKTNPNVTCGIIFDIAIARWNAANETEVQIVENTQKSIKRKKVHYEETIEAKEDDDRLTTLNYKSVELQTETSDIDDDLASIESVGVNEKLGDISERNFDGSSNLNKQNTDRDINDETLNVVMNKLEDSEIDEDENEDHINENETLVEPGKSTNINEN